MNQPGRQPQITGLLLAQYALLEAMVRHDAIGYHQVRETLADALATLTASKQVGEPVLRPLRQLLTMLDELHKPANLKEGRPRLDWQRVLEHCAAI